jgi:hypothetical protein
LRLRHILKDNNLIGCLEYDLRRYLDVDLRGLYSSPRTITQRQVMVWLRYLPSDAALSRRGLAGDRRSDMTEILQVATLNELRLLNNYYVRSHSNGEIDEPDLLSIENEEV